MIGLIKNIIYVAVSAVIFYFLLANVSLMKNDSHNIRADGQINNAQTAGHDDQTQIQKDLEDYVNQLSKDSNKNAREAKMQLMNDVKFKNKGIMPNDKNKGELLSEKQHIGDKEGILNNTLKNLSPMENHQAKAPELENFDDYAPTNLPITAKNPILSTNETIPNYMKVEKNAYYDKSTPLPINEFSTYQSANFQSERRTPWNEQTSGDNLSFFYKSNPFKSFDNISKNDVVDPAEWDKIMKKKEAASPLLSTNAMKQDKDGFMPSNHYSNEKKFAGLC